ncbi:WD40 repeat domain-containing serine/threonine protein kinase [Nocardiopsis mangrovi]|uniref:WD40 repeat domain-containing serine/threonine protein kinase n=1 Tax=Nocardiopsis mangrovi TaxID=1179818 RepID=A0ABV9E590_9ACTN
MLPLTADDPRRISAHTLLARIGGGGMGRVYLGRSRSGRLLAVKVVHPDHAGDPEFGERFAREVRAVQGISGAFTAPIVDAGPTDDPPWLATGYVPSVSLAEAVHRAGPLPEAAVAYLGLGLGEALRSVHAAGITHRDLKPSNILLAADGPRVIDFGVARSFDETPMTRTGQMVGTAAYMSPEQANGHRAGPASDVFALGGVLHFALTGRAPFPGDDHTVLFRIVRDEPDLGAVPGPLRDIVRRCLAKDPGLRPAPADLVAELARTVPAASGLSPAPYPGAPAVPGQPGPALVWPPLPVRGLITERERQARYFQENARAAGPGGAGAPRRGRTRLLVTFAAASTVLVIGAAALVAAQLTGVSPWAAADGSADGAGSPGAEDGVAPPRPWDGGVDPDGLDVESAFLHIEGHDPVASLAFDPVESDVIYAARLGRLDRWPIPPAPEGEFPTAESDEQTDIDGDGDTLVRSVATAPEGGTVATSTTSGEIRVIDSSSGAVRTVAPAEGDGGFPDASQRSLEERFPDGRTVMFAPDGRTLYAAGSRGVTRYDTATGEERPLGSPVAGDAVSLHPEGTRLLVTDGGTVRIVDAESGEEAGAFDSGASGRISAVYSGDGTRIITAGSDTVVRVFDAETFEAEQELTSHTSAVIAIAASPNGRVLATADQSGLITTWNLDTGAPLLENDNQPNPVRALAWDAEGARLAAGYENSLIMVWTRR